MCAAIDDEPAPGAAFRAEARQDPGSLRQLPSGSAAAIGTAFAGSAASVRSESTVSMIANSRSPNAIRPRAPGPRDSLAKTGPARAATEKVVSKSKCRAIEAANSASAMRSTIGIPGLRARAPSAISRFSVSILVSATTLCASPRLHRSSVSSRLASPVNRSKPRSRARSISAVSGLGSMTTSGRSKCEQKVDHAGADAAAAAQHDMAAPLDRPQSLHPHPLRAGQPRRGHRDEDAGENRPGEHQQHCRDDVENVIAMRRDIAVSGRRQRAHHEIGRRQPFDLE